MSFVQDSFFLHGAGGIAYDLSPRSYELKNAPIVVSGLSHLKIFSLFPIEFESLTYEIMVVLIIERSNHEV